MKEYLPKSMYQIKAINKAITAEPKEKKKPYTMPMIPGGLRAIYKTVA